MSLKESLGDYKRICRNYNIRNRFVCNLKKISADFILDKDSSAIDRQRSQFIVT